MTLILKEASLGSHQASKHTLSKTFTSIDRGEKCERRKYIEYEPWQWHVFAQHCTATLPPFAVAIVAVVTRCVASLSRELTLQPGLPFPDLGCSKQLHFGIM